MLETSAGFNTVGSGFLRVIDWDLGTTEGGSSGSPLFDSNKRIVGQLFGGFAACGNNSSDWYGFLARSWGGGFAAGPTDRLSDWLDEANTGAIVLNGMNAVALDQYEGDDTFSAAKPITSGEVQQRTIHVPSNNDFASFTLTEMNSVELGVLGMPGGTLVNLLLKGTNGASVLNAHTATNPTYVHPDLVAGTYFIDVSPPDISGPTSYSLHFNELKGDAFEADDSSVTASPIAIKDTQVHSIYPAADEDWVSFTVVDGGSFIVKTSGLIGNTQVEVLTDGLVSLKTGGTIGSGLFGRVTVQLQPGDYFAKVSGFGSGKVARYELLIEPDDDFLLQVMPAIISASQNKN